ncbi:MAG: MmcQ/YjbR family DNA-binding protein [Mycobacterium kyogaense]|uniref:MmcQ/YjbR family DNA-binding protein n=1 Tax=Mycobacterium kyogaense TaxID=2212479 RepID=UPI002FF7C3B7
MPHPVMFSEHDPGLAEVRAIALAYPGAFEKVSHGRPVFCAPKMFAVYGGSRKSTPDHVRYPYSVLVKVDESDRLALEQDDRFFLPAYLGPFGWLGLDLAAGEPDWAEVAELVDASYRMIAPKKLIRQLDEDRPGAPRT